MAGAMSETQRQKLVRGQRRRRDREAAEKMREAAAQLADTSKGYPTDVSNAIRALPLPGKAKPPTLREGALPKGDSEAVAQSEQHRYTPYGKLLQALRIMIMAWDDESARDARRYIGVGDDCRFPLVMGPIKSVEDARQVLAEALESSRLVELVRGP